MPKDVDDRADAKGGESKDDGGSKVGAARSARSSVFTTDPRSVPSQGGGGGGAKADGKGRVPGERATDADYDSSRECRLADFRSLELNSIAIVKRSDGSWTYAKLVEKSDGEAKGDTISGYSLEYQVDPDDEDACKIFCEEVRRAARACVSLFLPHLLSARSFPRLHSRRRSPACGCSDIASVAQSLRVVGVDIYE